MNRLNQLAINEQGFVFDPTTGESFTVNKTGLDILQGLKSEESVDAIAQTLADNYEVEYTEAEQDVNDFVERLRAFHLL